MHGTRPESNCSSSVQYGGKSAEAFCSGCLPWEKEHKEDNCVASVSRLERRIGKVRLWMCSAVPIGASVQYDCMALAILPGHFPKYGNTETDNWSLHLTHYL